MGNNCCGEVVDPHLPDPKLPYLFFYGTWHLVKPIQQPLNPIYSLSLIQLSQRPRLPVILLGQPANKIVDKAVHVKLIKKQGGPAIEPSLPCVGIGGVFFLSQPLKVALLVEYVDQLVEYSCQAPRIIEAPLS